MVRSLFASAALALVGLATLVSAQSYADFEFGEGELTLGDPVTSIQVVIGTVDQVKTACNDIEDCIGVLYQQSAGGGRLLRYDPNGSIQVGAGYSGISWRYDAPTRPSCPSDNSIWTSSSGFCQCDYAVDDQDTTYGCRAALVPSGIVERRARKMTRNHIMPGRPILPAF